MAILEAPSGLPAVIGDDQALVNELAGLEICPVSPTDIAALHGAVWSRVGEAPASGGQEAERVDRFDWPVIASRYLDLLDWARSEKASGRDRHASRGACSARA